MTSKPMTTVQENLNAIRNNLPDGVKIIVVSKTQPVERIMEAYTAGQRLFGENKAQELTQKFPLLPSEIEWHFIGHLQTNKVRLIAPIVDTIHSIDSWKLLQIVDNEARKCNRVIKCLLQMYIATEETKFGLDIEEAKSIVRSYQTADLKNITLSGLMGMASFTDDTSIIRKEFQTIHGYFSELKASFFSEDDHFRELSTGMTNDYHLAIEEGSTMVRLGTAIFGERNYL